ncbi:MAG: hypothetical protein FD147_1462 [Chloroflexi bacterium]|nr:MAG: hypothetical protein FD147_1462 [Chloroflexota bacterium]
MTQTPQNPANIPPMDMPEGLEPVYSNIARISHTPTEIIVDFSRLLPAELRFKVLSRIIMSPVGAKLLYRALGENISRYESAFGEIHIPGDSPLADDLFRQVHPPKNPESE